MYLRRVRKRSPLVAITSTRRNRRLRERASREGSKQRTNRREQQRRKRISSLGLQRHGWSGKALGNSSCLQRVWERQQWWREWIRQEGRDWGKETTVTRGRKEYEHSKKTRRNPKEKSKAVSEWERQTESERQVALDFYSANALCWSIASKQSAIKIWWAVLLISAFWGVCV